MRDITCHPRLRRCRAGCPVCSGTHKCPVRTGTIVTNAKAAAIAAIISGGPFDIYRADGHGAYYDKDGFFSKVGAIGVSIGLEWGGNWKSIVDKPHFQLPDWGSSNQGDKETLQDPGAFHEDVAIGGRKRS